MSPKPAHAMHCHFCARPVSEFETEVRRPGLRRVLEVVERAAAHPDTRAEVDRPARNEVRQIAVPLRLGEMGETHFKLERRWLDELERKHAQHGGDTLSVRGLRELIEAPERRGLDRDVQNLLILTFALQKGLRLTLHGRPASASIDRLDDALVLEAQALPDPKVWDHAVKLANTVFRIEASPLMNARNVAELAQALRRAAGEHREAVSALADSLEARLDARGIRTADTDRFRTTEATLSLLSALDHAEDDAVVQALARANVQTSDVAMGQCLRSAREVAVSLASNEWNVCDSAGGLAEPYRERAREIATDLDDALRRDEHAISLLEVLPRCHDRALKLLTTASAPAPHAPPEPPTPKPPTGSDTEGRGTQTGYRTVAAADVGAVFTEIKKAVREAGASRVEIEWRVYSDDDRTRQS